MKFNRSSGKKRLGAYPSASVVFSTTLSMLIFGIFIVVIVFGRQFSNQILENIEIQVFLEKDASLSKRRQIETILQDKEFVAGETGITFISREKAAEDFMAETGEDFVKFLGDNPLRDVFTVRLNKDFTDAESIQTIKYSIQDIDGVYEVTYVENLSEQIKVNINKIALVIISISLILIFVVVVLINNTIKLALFSQRFLIRSMQLVGATKGFIRRPFLLRAFAQGILAGSIASTGLFALLENGKYQIEDFDGLFDYQILAAILAVVLMSSALLSVVSAWRALNKYMSMTLDELY